MTSIAQEYRANARQCLSWAEAAIDPENREAFFSLAATWLSAAAWVETSNGAAENGAPGTAQPRVNDL